MLTRAEYIYLMEDARTHGVNERWGAYSERKISMPGEGGPCRFCDVAGLVLPNTCCDACPMSDGNIDECCDVVGVWRLERTPQNAIPIVDRLKSLDIPAFADKLVALGLLEA